MRNIKYFTANWCGPCKQFKPVMEQLKNEGLSIQFIDVDTNRLLVENSGVRSVPTCILEVDGKEVDRWTGALPKEEVKRRYTRM